MTKEQWKEAYRAARGQGVEKYQNDIADLAAYRRRNGMPPAGSKKDNHTAAKLIIGGNEYYGRNAGQKRSILLRVFGRANAITPSHAEGEAFYRAKANGETGKKAVLVVDRYPCGACGCSGGVKSLAKQMGITDLTVIVPGFAPITFNPQETQKNNPFLSKKQLAEWNRMH